MEITILGCGSSVGVPAISCNCAVCTEAKCDDSKNRRLRSSILINNNGHHIFLDTSPDFRAQVLRAQISSVHDVVYTHQHFDHCMGVNELRLMKSSREDGNIMLHTNADTLQYFKLAFAHLFGDSVTTDTSQKRFKIQKFEYYQPFQVDSLDFIPVLQHHGECDSAGFIIEKKLAYLTDFKMLPQKSMQELCKTHLELLIIQCIGYSEHRAHINFERSMKLVQILNPKRAILTHMGHEIDYDQVTSDVMEFTRNNHLKSTISPAYDGMKLHVT